MKMDPGCPTTAEAWNQKSSEKACSPRDYYHCIQTQHHKVTERCESAIWIEGGNCPVFNKTLKSIPCISKSSTACPTVIYKSNTVFNCIWELDNFPCLSLEVFSFIINHVNVCMPNSHDVMPLLDIPEHWFISATL
ncbi:uncharacterized protein LOC130050014 [Ostrea edulis]|uniref:uncharacterized protein LOC130050014 n=1 Tax=Ostrea edulis TaxID=37623 RepID=UPI0024AFBCCF|nr:uncharacterized protein LOC130050014 [Ostrea edulis]